jgi:hypothetical protein
MDHIVGMQVVETLSDVGQLAGGRDVQKRSVMKTYERESIGIGGAS